MAKITLQGLIATTPRHLVTQDGLAITSFRIAEQNDGTEITNWFTVTALKDLALNAYSSLSKGDRIVVSGTLKVRDWDNGERSGTSVEIEADSIGHDLSWGTSTFTRTSLAKAEQNSHACSCANCDK
jgi:single-strand DNA-binding protein